MIKEIINKHSVLICLFTSVLLMVIATLFYPGGSFLDKNAIGFSWSKNFMCNLFATKAMNGSENRGWIWAVIGMAFHSVGYGIFFIHMSKKMSSRVWATVLKCIGIANIILIFLIATPLHDFGVLSIILTLIGLFGVTTFILKTKLHLLKICCVICLLTYYIFFFFFGFGYLELAFIMQKVYILSSMLLVLALEYFTKYEDFVQIKFMKNQTDSI
jgi:hypothetical protein